MRALAFALACSFSLTAHAETGSSDAPRRRQDVLNVVQAPATSTMPRDSFRFSAQPALGGRADVMIFAGGPRARAQIVWLEGHPRTSWQRTRSKTFRLTEDEFQALAEWVDIVISEGELSLNDEETDGEMNVCTDGPDYRTERLDDRGATWIRGFCPIGNDPHPNERIARRLYAWCSIEWATELHAATEHRGSRGARGPCIHFSPSGKS